MAQAPALKQPAWGHSPASMGSARRRLWTLLALTVLLLGLAIYVVQNSRGTQRDARRELRKF